MPSDQVLEAVAELLARPVREVEVVDLPVVGEVEELLADHGVVDPPGLEGPEDLRDEPWEVGVDVGEVEPSQVVSDEPHASGDHVVQGPLERREERLPITVRDEVRLDRLAGPRGLRYADRSREDGGRAKSVGLEVDSDE